MCLQARSWNPCRNCNWWTRESLSQGESLRTKLVHALWVFMQQHYAPAQVFSGLLDFTGNKELILHIHMLVCSTLVAVKSTVLSLRMIFGVVCVPVDVCCLQAQQLTAPVTSASKLQLQGHQLYLLKDGESNGYMSPTLFSFHYHHFRTDSWWV